MNIANQLKCKVRSIIGGKVNRELLGAMIRSSLFDKVISFLLLTNYYKLAGLTQIYYISGG